MAQQNNKPIKLMDDYTHTFLYMLIISFIAGYVNTYSFFTRGGIFVSNHTGSLNKIGIAVYDQNLQAFINVFLPIMAFILSSFIIEHLKYKGKDVNSYHWQQKILAVEFLAFLAVGFIPGTVTPFYVNLFLTFIMGLQFASFRSMEGFTLNTAVAVGNMRTLGQLLYTALFIDKSKEYRRRALHFFIAFLMFAVSSYIAAVVSNILGVKSIWVCLPLLAFLFLKHMQVYKALVMESTIPAPVVTAQSSETPTANTPSAPAEDENTATQQPVAETETSKGEVSEEEPQKETAEEPVESANV